MNTFKMISKQARFAGVLITLLVSLSTAYTLSGSITGDQNTTWPVFFEITVTPTGTSTGGGVKNNVRKDFAFDNLSINFNGKVTPTGFGFAFTPKCSVLYNITQNLTNVNFVAKDTMRPVQRFVTLNNSIAYIGQPFQLNLETGDNSRLLSAYYYDYSVDGLSDKDSGKKWVKVGEEVKTKPEYILTGYHQRIKLDFFPHKYTFIPQVINSNFRLRVIIVDYWQNLKDTSYITLNVQPSTKVKNNYEQIKMGHHMQSKMFVDLRGRKTTLKEKASKMLLNISRPEILVKVK